MEPMEPVEQPSKFSEYGKMGGRPKYKPTARLRRQIEEFVSYGVPEHVVARALDIPLSTMRKHYRDQLDNGHIRTNAMVAGLLLDKAKNGSLPAMIFWLRCRGGWKEAGAEEQLGKKEAAIVAARQPDANSPFGKVIAARANVGSELSGLGRSADQWPVAHSGTTTQ